MAGRKANGEGTIFQRADGRWCGAGYVLAADGTRKRIYVYGATRRQAADKLAEKLADSNRGLASCWSTRWRGRGWTAGCRPSTAAPPRS